MSFDAGTIMGHLKLEKGGFASEIMNANSMTAAFGSTITSMIANPIAGAIQLAKKLTAAIYESVNAMAKQGDALGKAAEGLGVSVELLSGLAYAAKLGGTSVEALQGSLAILIKNMQGAADGSAQAKESFDRMGVSVTDAAGNLRPVGDVLLDIADAIAATPNATERASMAMAALGRSGAQLIPMLKGGKAGLVDLVKEAHAVGAAFTGENVKAMEEYNDLMVRLNEQFSGMFKGIKMDIMRDLADSLAIISGLLNKIGTDLGDIIKIAVPITGLLNAVALLRGQGREDLHKDIQDWSASARRDRVNESEAAASAGRAVSDSQVRQTKAFSDGVRRRLSKDDWERSLVL